MISKQLRIITGNIGDPVAVALANAFCKNGEWAVVRWQDENTLLHAVRQEHPDLLVLDSGSPELDFIEFSEKVREIAEVHIMVLMHRENSFLEKMLRQSGIDCRRYPEDPAELVQEICIRFGCCGTYIPHFISMDPDQRVTAFLQNAGISANLQGFHFLRSAIRRAMELPYCSGSVTQQIYPAVAEELNSTPARVERSIRHALSQMREQPQFTGILPRNSGGRQRMTNTEFIAFAVEYLRAGQCVKACV